MKKIFFALAIILTPISAISQNAMDALRISNTEINGTARYVSMGGAFTALGGDMTAISQNPAGIAIYRNNEFSLTLGGEWSNSTSNGISNKSADFTLDNIGLVGTFSTNKSKGLLSFNLGITYNSTNNNSFSYSTSNSALNSSFTNYIELITNGIPSSNLGVTDDFDAYYESDSPWLSILAYQSFLIEPVGNDTYWGLFNPGVSSGSSYMEVHEYGHNDDYSITLGANYNDRVYFGAALGIFDMNLTKNVSYSESLNNTYGLYASTQENGDEIITSSNFNYSTMYNTRGTGFNGKFGLIVRANNFLRFGASIHTPTLYNITQRMDAYLDNKIGVEVEDINSSYNKVLSQTIPSEVINRVEIKTPWNFQAGVAFIIKSRGIISADYKYTAYSKTRIKETSGVDFPVETDFYNNYFKGASTLKLGGEFRATDNLSIRCGYAFEQSAISNDLKDINVEVPTSGLQTSYLLPGHKSYYSGGLGYRVKAFSFDVAYQYNTQNCDVFAYSPIFLENSDPLIPASNSIKLKQHSIKFTVSTKF